MQHNTCTPDITGQNCDPVGGDVRVCCTRFQATPDQAIIFVGCQPPGSKVCECMYVCWVCECVLSQATPDQADAFVG